RRIGCQPHGAYDHAERCLHVQGNAAPPLGGHCSGGDEHRTERNALCCGMYGSRRAAAGEGAGTDRECVEGNGMKMEKKIILGSASPRRRELLSQIGVEFEVRVSGKEEIYKSSI